MSEQARICPTCRSEGFDTSLLGLDRCTFCDGTFGGNPPSEKVVAKNIALSGKAIREIKGRFVFTTPEDDFRYGDFAFYLESSDGTIASFSSENIFNFFDTFLAIARLMPETQEALKKIIKDVNLTPQTSAKVFQDAHKEHMEKKYPGWGKRSRSAEPAEHIKATGSIEDLGL